MKIVANAAVFSITILLSLNVYSLSDTRYVAVEKNIAPLIEQLITEKEANLKALTTTNIADSMINKQAKVGVSSKKWSDIEVARFNQRYGYRPTELLFTADVVAILANENNDTKAITLEELKEVFGCHQTPSHSRWTAGFNVKAQPYMLPFAVDHDFTMHRKFSSWVTCKEGEYANTQFLGTNGELVEKIESESASIGYVVYSDQIEETKWLSIIDNQGMTYDVNKETILSGRYPLANVYYMYIDLPPHRENFTEDEQFFIELTLSENHKEALNQYGFISLPQEAIHRNKVRLSLVEPIIEGGYK